MPQFSIIIVTYFNGIELRECIESILSSENLNEIILVDNGNSIETKSNIKTICDKNDCIKYIENSSNIGFGAACNIGAKIAKSAQLIFLNPDAKLEKNALNNILKIDGKPENAIIGGLVLDKNLKEQRGARRGELTILNATLSFLGFEKLKIGNYKNFNFNNAPLPKASIKVPNISGAFFSINKKEFEKINGFDEGYFLHLEDIDLCKSYRNIGGEVWFNPNAIAIHIKGASGGSKLFVEWHKYKGFMRYFWKHNNVFGKFFTSLIALPLLIAIMGRLLLSKRQYE